jgi:hypothetical protein
MKTKKRPTRLEHISETFAKWSLMTTFHCYPKIFQSKSGTWRCVWSLIFIIFCSLTFQLVYREVRQYFEYDVVSKIRVFYEKSSPFPTVTICDANPFSTVYAERLLENVKSPREFFAHLNFSKFKASLIEMEYKKNSIMKQAFNLSDAQKRKTRLFPRSNTIVLFQ